MRSILVLRGGALGDLLLTLPLLQSLRRRWPESRIEVVGNALAAVLAVDAGCIDACHSQHESRWLGLFFPDLPPTLRAWLSAFDLVINAWPDTDGQIRRHFPARPGQQFISVPQIREGHGSAWSQLLEPTLKELGPDRTDDRRWQLLDISRQSKLESRRRLASLLPATTESPVALHPGSGSNRKNAPLTEWLELSRRLAPRPVLFILGEAEASLLPALRGATPAPVYLLQEWPLPLLAGALSICGGYVGHDTGVSHLAAAVGLRCVLLFGPTDPAVWAPPGDHVEILRPRTDRVTLPMDEVIARIQSWDTQPRIGAD